MLLPVDLLVEDTPNTDAGYLSVLNCVYGDIEIRFDKDNPSDVAKAKQIITDMLNRGYLLFAEHDGTTERVHGFDHETNEYVLRAPPATTRVARIAHICATCQAPIAAGETYASIKGRKVHVACGPPAPASKKRRLPLQRTKVTAIAPTAGG